MTRLSSAISSLMNPSVDTTGFVSHGERLALSLEGEAAHKYLEQCFIVLEGLQVCADEAGVYTSGSGKSGTPLSPELKGKALKWADAADDLSEGEADLRTDDITDTLSFEALAISMESDNIIMRILEGIRKTFKAIFDFVLGLFGIGAKKASWAYKEAQRLDAEIKNIPDGGHIARIHSETFNRLNVEGHLGTAGDLHVHADHFLARLKAIATYYGSAVGGDFKNLCDHSVTVASAEAPTDNQWEDVTRALKKSINGASDAIGVSEFGPSAQSRDSYDRTVVYRESKPYIGNLVFQVRMVMDHALLNTTDKAKQVEAYTEFKVTTTYTAHGMKHQLGHYDKDSERLEMHYDKQSLSNLMTLSKAFARQGEGFAELKPKLESLHKTVLDSVDRLLVAQKEGRAAEHQLSQISAFRAVSKYILGQVKFMGEMVSDGTLTSSRLNDVVRDCLPKKKEAA
jgi:hypothetical protein